MPTFSPVTRSHRKPFTQGPGWRGSKASCYRINSNAPRRGTQQLEARQQVIPKNSPGENIPPHRIPAASPWWEGQAWCRKGGPFFLALKLCLPLWSPRVNRFWDPRARTPLIEKRGFPRPLSQEIVWYTSHSGKQARNPTSQPDGCPPHSHEDYVPTSF